MNTIVISEQAILNDNAAAVAEAIELGADPNARWEHLVTPVEFAVGHLKYNVVKELLLRGADPNLKDAEGDSAVTLAVSAYRKAPELLDLVLSGGGNPNARLPDGNPVIIRFINDRDLKWIRRLKEAGANIDDRDRSGQPLVINAGIIEFWDVLWCLLELGAKYDYSGEPWTLVDVFASPEATPPDSPLWPYKVKVWHFLNDRGMKLPKLQ